MRIFFIAFCLCCALSSSLSSAAEFSGMVVDADTEKPIDTRIYVRNQAGKFFHVKSKDGVAIPYDRRRSEKSIEIHTTISAHPFQANLPPGQYAITVEKGKEYVATRLDVTIGDGRNAPVTIRLKRWSDLSAQGWYSGETHVHREVAELPLLQKAEDINVAFPLTAWVTDSEETPVTHNKNTSRIPPAQLVRIDKNHVFWPINTEYEIFTVRGKTHTLGAVFILNHKTQFALPAPPVGPIAQAARAQDAFLELDKHNWPWSMMLVPQMNVDLYELANNHMWRTEFMFADWYPEYAAKYMNIEMIDGRFTERGWIDFGFQTYYALLNCGFQLQPTAGTASGVHPVPFGYGRVYVKLEGEFTYDKWVKGLLAGRSFVTTGPLLTVSAKRSEDSRVHVTGQFQSTAKPISIEILLNGEVVGRTPTILDVSADGVYRIPIDHFVKLDASSWVAVRAFTKGDGDRVRFAHSAPVHFKVPGKPLRPTRTQRDYLVDRVQNELDRNRGVISRDGLREFEQALQRFTNIGVDD